MSNMFRQYFQKYFWVALLVIAFVLGLLISKGPDKELIQKFETEREIHRQEIERRDARIKALGEAGRTIKEKAIQDSIRFSEALQVKDKRILTLQIKLRNAEKLKGADAPVLDSLRHAMYGANSLHSN
jgi:hypothetical protein